MQNHRMASRWGIKAAVTRAVRFTAEVPRPLHQEGTCPAGKSGRWVVPGPSSPPLSPKIHRAALTAVTQ